ncbi:MAG TPA: arsenical resistance operon transcriptional repressor ArsD [Clostridium sp.]|jgi:hypothetical protein|nr:arsenical resistance operon transcriptional repressor ArsD [Clostridium sp.]
MKKMMIFEPAMCCSTGLCGPSIDPELLRVSTVVDNLRKKGVSIERYNLTGSPQVFVDNKTINKVLNREGIEMLPITMVDGAIVKTKAYPTNREFCKLLGISEDYLKTGLKVKSKGCDCGGRCC